MNKSINDYNFFELCNFEINKVKRDEISSTINKLIWEKFLMNDFEKIIDEKDIEVINKMVEDGKDIIYFIISKYPNIKDILWKIAENTKKEIILDFIDSELDEVKIALKFVKNEDLRNLYNEKRLLYLKAKEIATAEKWEELYSIFQGYPNIN